MDIFTAMKERRSCRDYSSEPISSETIEKILEAASFAPSPMNMQPWQFIVITKQDVKNEIAKEAERCRDWALKDCGQKWAGSYRMDFVKSAPVLIAVTGDPKKTGIDAFMKDDGNVGYQYACAAAIQNMILAAHALGIGSLWFTFFEKKNIAKILGIEEGKPLISIVCLGKCSSVPAPLPRKPVKDKTIYIS
jgi:5,6-dimethylbenzimidazole synthase